MERKKASYVEGTVSIIGNICLFALKYWAGIVSGSIALMADAWHTLSDSISSVVVIVGAKLASKQPDEDHPFGHGRWELISAIIIAIILVLIAFGFITDSISQLRTKESANFGTLAIVITVVSIVVKELMAQYAFFLGRRSDSTIVKADGWHHRTDALSSLVILIGILFKNYFWWIDGVLGLLVSLMIMYAAYAILKESVSKILGEEPGEELIKEILGHMRSLYDYDLHPHHFHLHNYISSKELTFHIKIDNMLSVEEGHAIATAIEELIDEKLSLKSTIHLEPVDYAHKND
ncbi:MAG: cation transporter [Bacteroidetes bacterium]|nr:MAG: cation transporter [Bacteroidota bacterium]RLD95074.1 MAG: cation transporter [Bacteroidota bacterium]